jgi:hypothetical protein
MRLRGAAWLACALTAALFAAAAAQAAPPKVQLNAADVLDISSCVGRELDAASRAAVAAARESDASSARAVEALATWGKGGRLDSFLEQADDNNALLVTHERQVARLGSAGLTRKALLVRAPDRLREGDTR